LVGDITRGKAAYNSPPVGAPAASPGGACYSCHGVAGEGAGGPNITGATGTALGSGIGGWTEQQFHDAVRLAKNRNGARLCALMAAFSATGAASVSDQDIADLYAYLMSLNVATVQPGTYCPNG
jgi:cytochrome c553